MEQTFIPANIELTFTEAGKQKFDEVVSWLNSLEDSAATFALRASWWRQISYLASYGQNRYRVELHTNFAEHSFSICWFRQTVEGEQFAWSGGLIFHRAAQGWSVHT